MENVMKNISFEKLLLVASIGLLSACAVTPPPSSTENKPKAELTVLMDQAAAAEKTGPKEATLRQYEEAAKLYPTSKLPWLKIAQIQFDSANYGQAIIAAQQVISRDEQDKVANSILSVSGLRVSTKALADLSRQNELTGSVRNEAQDLAKVLRESLGEKVLVPTPVAVEVPRKLRPVVRPGKVRATANAEAKTPSSPAVLPAGGGSPFGGLK
jgi:tetratricopeptide (TPR) repeat protein